MFAKADAPPEGIDPGQWALDEYRAWRKIHMSGSDAPPPPSLLKEMVAAMKEESPE